MLHLAGLLPWKHSYCLYGVTNTCLSMNLKLVCTDDRGIAFFLFVFVPRL